MHGFDDWQRLDPTEHYIAARERMATLLEEAARERTLSAIRSINEPATSPGLRTRLGRWLVRFGAALAQDRETAALQR